MRTYDISDIRFYHRGHFFSRGAMRFFRSRVLPMVYQGRGGIYFVTSEQFVSSTGYVAPRKFSIRRFDPVSGTITTAGAFNEIGTAREARAVARMLAAGPSRMFAYQTAMAALTL